MKYLLGLLLSFGISTAPGAAETHRSESDLLGLLPLQTIGEIGAQDLRDNIYSLIRNDEQRVLRADSIADLRALDIDNYIIQDDAIIFVSGYLAAGDHGGVTYRYDSSCADTDDSGLILEPTVGSGCYRMITPINTLYDARWFGVVADNATDNNVALSRISTAAVEVIFPIGQSLTSLTWYPTRGFSGQGKDNVTTEGSSLEATATWSGGDYFIDVRDIDTRNQTWADIKIDGNQKMKYVFGASDLDHSEGGNAGFHIWDRVAFFGASSGGYLFYFPDTVGSSSMETVGGVCLQCFFNGNFGSGMIYLGIGSDDFTFINARLEHFNTPTVYPVRIHGVDISFLNTFYAVGSDTAAGIDALFFLTSGGTSRTFDGLFIEPSSITFTNWKYSFRCRISCSMTVDEVHLEGVGPTLPSDSAFVVVDNAGCCSGRIEVRNVGNGFGGIGTTKLLVIDTIASPTAGTRMEFVFSNVNGFADLITISGSDASSGQQVHLVGSHKDITYNTGWGFDGTNPTFISYSPTIISNDNLDIIGANAAVARFICPFDAYIQEIRTVTNAALATADATLTAAIAGSNISGGVVTVTQSGSAAGDIDIASPTFASNDNECDAGELVTVTVSGSNSAGTANVQVYFGARG